MAAGIGEASAILTVAQLGISLSNSLITYIGEVHDAPFRILRISNEVATTSERLKDIGELVDKNTETHIFNEEGIHSAVRCSEECHKIIDEVKSVLQKGGWQKKSEALEKDEIDTSLFSTLRWPFLRRSLDVPRAELQRIKIDLALLFSSAMALGASNSIDKAKFRQDIPGLQRTREWAAKMETQARRRAQDQYGDYAPRGRVRDTYWIDEDPEMLQAFIAYQERRIQEEEDNRAMARAALLQAEEDNKRKTEEKTRREIEQSAIDAYKREQASLKARTIEMKDAFRNELSRLGLDSDQIELIVDNSNLNFGENTTDATGPTVRPVGPRVLSNGSTAMQSQAETTEDTNEGAATSTGSGRSRRELPWRRRSRKIEYHNNDRERSLDFVLSDKCSAANGSLAIETWLLDVFSSWKTEIRPSVTWLEKNFGKKDKSLDVWRRFAELKPLWRKTVSEFLNARNRGEDVEWNLYSIELPRRTSRMSFLGLKHDDQTIQVVLFKREQSQTVEKGGTISPENISWETSRLISPYSNDKGLQAQKGLDNHHSRTHPKVTFADEVTEGLNREHTARGSHDPLHFRNEDEIRKAIMKLEATKTRAFLASDQERVGEINGMILEAQEKLHHTLSPRQREILYGNSNDKPLEAMKDPYAATQAGPPDGLHGVQLSSNRSYQKQPREYSKTTDVTEEIVIPRDDRNRLLEKLEDDTFQDVIAEGERTTSLSPNNERHHYLAGEDPYSVNESRRRRRGHYEEDDVVIIEGRDNGGSWDRSRSEAPRGSSDDFYGRPGRGRELVVRRGDPKRSETFENEHGGHPPRISLPPPLPPEEDYVRPDQLGMPLPRPFETPPEREEVIISSDEYDRRRAKRIARNALPSRRGEVGFREGLRTPRRAPPTRGLLHERTSNRASDKGYTKERIGTLQLKLVELRNEEDVARRNQDLVTANDLAYYAIPETRDRIWRLERESLQRHVGHTNGYIPRDVIRHPQLRSTPPVVTRTSKLDNGMKGPDDEGRGLILRTGGSRHPPDYMQERVLDRSIRVQGDGENLYSPDKYIKPRKYQERTDSWQSIDGEQDVPRVSRRPTMESDRAEMYRYKQPDSGYLSKVHPERSRRRPPHRDLERVRGRERPSRQNFSSASSEDDDYPPILGRTSSLPEAKLSDNEIITKTLQRYTTFGGDELPATATTSKQTPPIDNLPSTPKDHQGIGIVDTETQRAPAAAHGVQPEPVAATIGESTTKPGAGLDLEKRSKEPRILTDKRDPHSAANKPYNLDTSVFPPRPFIRPVHVDSTPVSLGQAREAAHNCGLYNDEITLPSFPPQAACLQHVQPIYFSVPVADGHPNVYQPHNPETKTPATPALEAERGDISQEARISEVSDASSDGNRRERLHRQDRKATVEDFEPGLE